MPLPLRTLLPRDFNPVLTGESGQCAIRMVAGLLCACYMLALPHSWSNLSQTMHRVAPAAAYALFGYVWAWVTHYRLGTLKGRILVALTIDQCLVASYMHFGQEPALPWAWAMPFANIGSGLRFGPHYSTIGAIVGTVAGAVAFGTSPYWRSVPFVSMGLLALNAILPIYVTKLAAHVWAEKRESEKRAAEMEKAAKTDFLTSALNRAGFEAELANSLGVDADRQPLAVMLLDLDGFKSINDTAGHAAGDEVLRRAAQRVRSLIRKQDVIARLGGDEFGLVIRGAVDRARVAKLSAMIQSALSHITVPDHPTLRIGVSIGYQLVNDDRPIAAATVLAAADAMMYAAKRAPCRRQLPPTAGRQTPHPSERATIG